MLPGLPEIIIIVVLLIIIACIVAIVKVIRSSLSASRKIVWILLSIVISFIVLQVILMAMKYWFNKP
mgnify:FL=1